MSRGWSIYQNFRGFDIRGGPYVYINREIQGMPVCEKQNGQIIIQFGIAKKE